MYRNSKAHKGACNDCQERVRGTCKACGRAFCEKHWVARMQTCVHCAERCLVGACKQFATHKCLRCDLPSCQVHRPPSKERCSSCEENFKDALAERVEDFEWSDRRSRSDAVLKFGGFVVVMAVMGQWWIALGGLAFTGGVFAIGKRTATKEHAQRLVQKKARKNS